MVKSKGIYSPQNFVCVVTGKCYIMNHDDIIEDIHYLLSQNKIETTDYSLDEIDHIVENNLNVVLVDVSGFNEDDEWVQDYRWFEVPEDFNEESESDV